MQCGAVAGSGGKEGVMGWAPVMCDRLLTYQGMLELVLGRKKKPTQKAGAEMQCCLLGHLAE